MNKMSKEQASGNLLLSVVQAQDAENAQNALAQLGLNVIRLPSVGGFLGRRNATLMMNLPEQFREAAMQSLQDNCRQRIEYIAIPLESAPLPMPTPTPVTIGGATVFSLEIDHYEEI